VTTHDGFGSAEWFDAWYEAFAPDAPRFPLPTTGEGFQADLHPGTARILRQPWRFLRAPVNSHTPQYGWKLIDTPSAKELGNAFARALSASRCHGVEIDLLAADGATVRSLSELRRVGWKVSFEERERAAIIDLDQNWDVYWKARSSNIRKSLGKQERQLGRAGDVLFADSAQSDEWSGTLEEGLALEARSWKGTEGSAILNRPAEARFYRRIAEAAATKRRLRLFSLALSGRMIAFYLTVVEGRRLFWLKTAYDETYAHYGPAILLFRWGLAACFDDPSIRAVHIPGAPEWTLRWATRTQSLLTARVLPPRSVVALADRAETLGRCVRDRIGARRTGA
jgi:CelD/BcsL family acetyltransferase involved in cellulose biosynthesis